MHASAETVETGQQFIPLGKAAASLEISSRQLRALLFEHGLALYRFGVRSPRVAAHDLAVLVRRARETG